MTWKLQGGQRVPDFDGDMAGYWNPMYIIGYGMPFLLLELEEAGVMKVLKRSTATWAMVDHMN